jgi:hypothetical protein
MSDKMNPPFLTLPVELVYRILDNLDELTILCAMQNVCTRTNAILNTYHRYQVNIIFNTLYFSTIFLIDYYFLPLSSSLLDKTKTNVKNTGIKDQ